MSDNSASSNIGGFFLSGLTLLFIGLKMTGHIDWSWWWVFSPFWLPVAIFLFILFTMVAVGALARLIVGEK